MINHPFTLLDTEQAEEDGKAVTGKQKKKKHFPCSQKVKMQKEVELVKFIQKKQNVHPRKGRW